MKRLVRNSALASCLVLLLLVSCGEKNRRADVLAPKKLEAILFDYHLAQVMINDLPSTERYKKDLYFDYVYEKHGVTSAEVDSALVYYARYPEALSEIYANLSDRVKNTQKRLAEEDIQVESHQPVAVVGDSADLWYETRVKLMYPSVLGNRFDFTIPSDSNFKANDCFEWSGEVMFLPDEPDSANHYLHLSLMAKFANDSVLSVDTLLYASGAYNLLLTDTLGARLKTLHGNAYYKSKKPGHDALLYGMRLMRYRNSSLPTFSSVDSLRPVANTLKTQSILMVSGKELKR